MDGIDFLWQQVTGQMADEMQLSDSSESDDAISCYCCGRPSGDWHELWARSLRPSTGSGRTEFGGSEKGKKILSSVSPWQTILKVLTMVNLSAKRRSIYFRGYTTAISGLAVNRPDDNFASPTGTKDLQRLPRLVGAKLDRSPVFFPGTQLRHRIREALLKGACEAAGGQLPLKDHLMLIQGVAIGEMAKELSSVSMAGIVEREGGLRSVNPLISLGGFWRHAGSLGVNDGIPVDSVFLQKDSPANRFGHP
ncbi:hypothetical protein [Endozoicomonas sp. YOMI1]|uniref:hypothetical protein n=1 Tax=Endozoicomonas sp. YOMI1 TaxID=2828739 RepID=UPI002147E2FD|nr:hypothetical protein [Endozoicomonas sp. YOMI1]